MCRVIRNMSEVLFFLAGAHFCGQTDMQWRNDQDTIGTMHHSAHCIGAKGQAYQEMEMQYASSCLAASPVSPYIGTRGFFFQGDDLNDVGRWIK